MLTTNKTSRTRLMAGAGALALLAAAGLGLTASGTAAARTVRTTVETATGVTFTNGEQATPQPAPAPDPQPAPDVKAIPAPAPAPVRETKPASVEAPMPEAPGMPAMAEAPVPPVGARGTDGTYMITTDKDGKRIIRHGRYVKLNRDGSATMIGEIAPPAMPPMPQIPEISSQNCTLTSRTDEMVIHDTKGGKRRIVICTNRIQKVAAEGAAMAANSKGMERNAYTQALIGLRKTRASTLADKGMSAEERAGVLEGIDEAIHELEGDLAKAD